MRNRRGNLEHEGADFRGGGGFRQALGRIFGDGENPLGWALTVGTVAGIRVRVHLFFLIYIAGQLVSSLSPGHMGIAYMALSMGLLFVLVLLHEFGHCFACRAVGGEADQILMWPLGGLASCLPPRRWKADFITTAGGPAVNLAIVPLTGLALLLVGRGETILFNPLKPAATVGVLDSYWLVGLWWAHYINILLLLFNVLLPMYPMDGGRMLHALLWRSQGRRRATETATLVGMVVAGVVAVGALVTENVTLVLIAIFGAVVCWTERRALRTGADVADPVLAGAGYDPDDDEFDPAPRGPSKSEVRRRERDAAEQAEVDRILAKIAASGMASLSRAERKALERATEKKRRG